MRSLPLNLAAFAVAAVFVLAVSFAIVRTGAFDGGGSGDVVSNPTETPAVLEATATPSSSPAAAD